jgi:hypothetical protein
MHSRTQNDKLLRENTVIMMGMQGCTVEKIYKEIEGTMSEAEILTLLRERGINTLFEGRTYNPIPDEPPETSLYGVVSTSRYDKDKDMAYVDNEHRIGIASLREAAVGMSNILAQHVLAAGRSIYDKADPKTIQGMPSKHLRAVTSAFKDIVTMEKLINEKGAEDGFLKAMFGNNLIVSADEDGFGKNDFDENGRLKKSSVIRAQSEKIRALFSLAQEVGKGKSAELASVFAGSTDTESDVKPNQNDAQEASFVYTKPKMDIKADYAVDLGKKADALGKELAIKALAIKNKMEGK